MDLKNLVKGEVGIEKMFQELQAIAEEENIMWQAESRSKGIHTVLYETEIPEMSDDEIIIEDEKYSMSIDVSHITKIMREVDRIEPDEEIDEVRYRLEVKPGMKVIIIAVFPK